MRTRKNPTYKWLHEVYVMGMFVGHETGDPRTVARKTRRDYNTNSVELRKIWQIRRQL